MKKSISLTSRSSRNSRYVKTTAIQKLVSTPSNCISVSSISIKPVKERTVRKGVRSWNTSSGGCSGSGASVEGITSGTLDAYGGGEERGLGASNRDKVNELECEGWWLFKIENARVKKEEAGCCCCWIGGMEEGAKTNWVICDGTGICEMELDLEVLHEDLSPLDDRAVGVGG